MNERSVFLAALEIDDAPKRAAYLRDACGNDANLRRGVEELLAASNQAGSFMDAPAATIGASDMETAGSGQVSLEFLSPSDQPGLLGRLETYEIARVIGRGGMGIVLEGRDTRLERVVAVKVLAPQLAASAAARQRFLREAKAAAAVRDEHVVTIYAVEEKEGLPYLVMELIAGMSLQERIDRDGPLEVNDILRIGMQTAAGLAAAHAQGLIHRDIKPANILLENGVERVKLTDFGLARVVDDATLSQSGIIAGTPQYMAPEQAKGEAVDHRADLFSLGSVLYAMCTGRPPFRASTTMGTLKRVCEDTLSPIRENNPNIPQWLVELIDRLHAKDPAGRYQSAAEVAEVLSQHLAQLQHPAAHDSKISTAAKSQIQNPKSQIGPRRWALAAVAAIALLFVSLSLTEATGVTQVLPTVIRIVTGEGTLVVETDPDVQVTLEGNGDLVFNLAGGQTIRVPTGRYRVKATKDGKPVALEKDLVTVTRGDKQVVRVRLETAATIASGPARAERGAFVVLTGKGAELRKYDTLAQAVLGASVGNTIEIRGNGPFVTEPIKVTRALAIRAGEGFRPVITLSAAGARADQYMLRGEASLVLEGLEFRRVDSVPQLEGEPWQVILDSVHPLYVANCRLLARGVNTCIGGDLSVCELRNSEFLIDTPTSGLSNFLTARQRFLIDNCLHTGALGVAIWHVGKSDIRIEMTRNTFRTPGEAFKVYYKVDPTTVGSDQDQPTREVRVEAKGNIFDAMCAFVVGQDPPGSILPEEIQRQLTRVFSWQGERNLYAVDSYLTLMVHWKQKREVEIAIRDLDDWKGFWDTLEPGSIQGGRVVYQGANFSSKAKRSPELITPEDFRLHSDSGGYRAGPDGEDLGADIDLVGPGAAYERWKKTPQYQEWLKETGQLNE